jgi:hypothetical protein
MWCSNGISDGGETLYFEFENVTTVKQIITVFDTDFNYSIKQTQNSKRQAQQRVGIPPELVKDYTVKLWKNGEVIAEKNICDNHQRRNVIEFPQTDCDKVTLTVFSTNGCCDAHVFEVRIY